ncbi:PEP-CTERM sorting domain-containing protein [Geitlerinema splendidum]|nr:PEP-CTERM sorting domain-containing protein [Geitlerinema splendidum]
MKLLSAKVLIATTAIAVCGIVTSGQSAIAGTLYQGWNYAQDSFKDGTGGNGAFEIYGIAVHQQGDQITVGINANTGAGGWYDRVSSRLLDGHIGWGDLIFDFSGVQYGLRFATKSNSGVSELGLYTGITTKDLTVENDGWESLQAHNNGSGKHNSLGDFKSSEMSYYTDKRNAPVVMASGTKVANDNFQALGKAELGALGLDFSGAFGVANNILGSQTFGFTFTRTADMLGDFVASLFFECINDGIAIKGNLAENPVIPQTEVPEPTSIVSLALIGLALSGGLKKRTQAA